VRWEVGVSGRKSDVKQLVWIDTTSGDGNRWWRPFGKIIVPPQAIAYYAALYQKKAIVRFYERAIETFQRLLVSLEQNLPRFDIQRKSLNLALRNNATIEDIR